MAIELIRDSITGVQVPNWVRHAWPLRVTADSNETGLSSKIFVYHAEMGDDPYQGDVFECVASIQQMSEIPEDAPGVGEGGNLVPYYRKDVLTFYCRNSEQADSLWEKVQADVRDLLRNHRAMQNLLTSETVTISG